MSGKRTPRTAHPEKLDLRPDDVVEKRRREPLRFLFAVPTEGGKLDFGPLKLALGRAVDTVSDQLEANVVRIFSSTGLASFKTV